MSRGLASLSYDSWRGNSRPTSLHVQCGFRQVPPAHREWSINAPMEASKCKCRILSEMTANAIITVLMFLLRQSQRWIFRHPGMLNEFYDFSYPPSPCIFEGLSTRYAKRLTKMRADISSSVEAWHGGVFIFLLWRITFVQSVLIGLVSIDE